MEHDPHAGFIVAAYCVAGLVIAAMVLATVLDHRGLKRDLRRLGGRDGT